MTETKQSTLVDATPQFVAENENAGGRTLAGEGYPAPEVMPDGVLKGEEKKEKDKEEKDYSVKAPQIPNTIEDALFAFLSGDFMKYCALSFGSWVKAIGHDMDVAEYLIKNRDDILDKGRQWVQDVKNLARGETAEKREMLAAQKKADKAAAKEAKKAEKESKEAAKKAEKEAKEAAKKAEKEAKEAAKKAAKDAKEAAKKAKDGAEKPKTKDAPKKEKGTEKPKAQDGKKKNRHRNKSKAKDKPKAKAEKQTLQQHGKAAQNRRQTKAGKAKAGQQVGRKKTKYRQEVAKYTSLNKAIRRANNRSVNRTQNRTRQQIRPNNGRGGMS